MLFVAWGEESSSKAQANCSASCLLDGLPWNVMPDDPHNRLASTDTPLPRAFMMHPFGPCGNGREVNHFLSLGKT